MVFLLLFNILWTNLIDLLRSHFTISNKSVLYYNTSLNLRVHVGAGGHVCFVLDGAHTAVLEVECALTV